MDEIVYNNTSIRIDIKLKEQLIQLAKKDGRTLNSLIALALKQFVEAQHEATHITRRTTQGTGL